MLLILHRETKSKNYFLQNYIFIAITLLKVLGLKSLNDDKPSKNVLENISKSTKEEKAMYLKQIASHVVDKYVVDKSRNQQIFEHAQRIEKSEPNAQANADGRYPCRAPGCNKTHDGKLRKDHETMHNPPVDIQRFSPNSFVLNSSKCEEDRDDMLAYQKALLDYCMLVLNFWNAIADGDGERIFR